MIERSYNAVLIIRTEYQGDLVGLADIKERLELLGIKATLPQDSGPIVLTIEKPFKGN